MNKIDCAVSEQRVPHRATAPLLSIYIPTFHRTADMITTVRCIASQVTGGLESKVEVVISDNASGPETQAAIRQLADEFPCISYYFNAVDQGGSWAIYAAPWRAAGRWVWVFGSDDFLFPGGVAAVLNKLEAEDPSLLTMNKRVLDKHLNERLHAVNGIPDRNFVGFDNLMRAVGVHQVFFMSSTVESVERGRELDPYPYRTADTYHNYVIAYLAKHRDRRCTYLSSNHLGHRSDNSVMSLYRSTTAYDLSVKFPVVLWGFFDQLGLPPDFYEQIQGSRYINTYDTPKVTYVDNMFEYMLRTMANGGLINSFMRAALERILKDCRPGRLEQFAEIERINEGMRVLQSDLDDLREQHERKSQQIYNRRDELFDYAIKTFTDKIVPA